MSTYKEVVYMILDELKLVSDDAQFTEEHIIYLLGKYRAFILKQRYSDLKKIIPESNYQTITIDLVKVTSEEKCLGDTFLKSEEEIPSLMTVGKIKVYPTNFFQGEISYINMDRFKYVGNNKYLSNIIYCTIGPDKHLYVKSNNPQYLYLEQLYLTGIFQDSSKIINSDSCDILDTEYPLEEALIPVVTELIVKELTNSIYKPTDEENNAKDDLTNLSKK